MTTVTFQVSKTGKGKLFLHSGPDFRQDVPAVRYGFEEPDDRRKEKLQ